MEAPRDAVWHYWSAFVERYRVWDYLPQVEVTDNSLDIQQCAFAEMFTHLGCPWELTSLMRDMEREALEHLGSLVDDASTGRQVMMGRPESESLMPILNDLTFVSCHLRERNSNMKNCHRYGPNYPGLSRCSRDDVVDHMDTVWLMHKVLTACCMIHC